MAAEEGTPAPLETEIGVFDLEYIGGDLRATARKLRAASLELDDDDPDATEEIRALLDAARPQIKEAAEKVTEAASLLKAAKSPDGGS